MPVSRYDLRFYLWALLIPNLLLVVTVASVLSPALLRTNRKGSLPVSVKLVELFRVASARRCVSSLVSTLSFD